MSILNDKMTLMGFLAGLIICAGQALAVDLEALAEREELTIVVTDSGLGGLSVVADLDRRAREHQTHRRLNLIFYNALFDAESGYNSLPTREDRVRIFNNALTDMGERFDADLILVACNTLSVLLPDCPYAQEGEVPVVGIVDMGVEMMEEALKKEPEAKVILLATPVTVEERSHLDGLARKGVEAARVVEQPCPELTYYIEQDFEGFDTELMISAYVTEAASKLGDNPPPVFASFNCTHFGYSESLWQREFEAAGLPLKGILNPNVRMGDFLFREELRGRFDSTEVAIRAVTMVPISAAAVDSIGRAIGDDSSQTAKALENHELMPGLFSR